MRGLARFSTQLYVAITLSSAACAQPPPIRDLPFTQDERNLLLLLRGEASAGAVRNATLEAMRDLDVIVVEYDHGGEITKPILDEAEKTFGRVQPAMDFVEKRKSFRSGTAVATFQLVGMSNFDGVRLARQTPLIGTVFCNFDLDAPETKYDPAAILSSLETARQSGFVAINAAVVRNPDTATLKETLRLQANCVDQLAERLRQDDRILKSGGYTIGIVERPVYLWRKRSEEPHCKWFGVSRDAAPPGQVWRSGVGVQMYLASAYIETYVVATVRPSVAILLRRQGVVIGIWSEADDPILKDAYRWSYESLVPLFDFERKLGAEPVLIGVNGEMSQSLRDFQDRMSR